MKSHNTAQSFKKDSLAKWMSVCLPTKWMWVWISKQYDGKNR